MREPLRRRGGAVALPLVLDTDIGTDVDDALALAFALRHSEIDLRAVTTVSGDTARRAQIAAKLLRLAGREDIEVAAGLDTPRVPDGARSPWMGHEGEGLLAPGESPPISSRDGVSVLLDAADGQTEIAVIGMQTNVAAALEREPSLVERIPRLALMGGVFDTPGDATPAVAASDDHNLVVDPQSAARVLSAGVPLLYVPLNVTVRTVLTRAHQRRLAAGDALCRALADLVDRWAPILQRRPRLPPDQMAALHDPLTVAALVDRRFVTIERLPVAVAVRGGIVRTVIDQAAGRDAEVVTDVEAQGFADFWLETVLG